MCIMSKKFTIIELLMIIAIIGVLASLLLPSMSRARAKVKQSVCLSNSKQISLASQLAISWNITAYGPSDSAGNRWTKKLLGSYIDHTSGNQPSPAFNCPTGFDQMPTTPTSA